MRGFLSATSGKILLPFFLTSVSFSEFLTSHQPTERGRVKLAQGKELGAVEQESDI
jgi:hypothetical protein